ncbi:MAG TPA: TfoX/Sxy family protein [Burkholderiales bacterium]
MAYNEALANRIREALAREKGVDEIKMMGGLCFMIGGHMALGIVGTDLMIRVGPDGYERALARVHAREMDFTGRSMRGFVFVEPAGIKTKRSLASWVGPAAAFAKSLPPKASHTKSRERKSTSMSPLMRSR